MVLLNYLPVLTVCLVVQITMKGNKELFSMFTVVFWFLKLRKCILFQKKYTL